MGHGYVCSYFDGEFGQRLLPDLLADEYAPLYTEHGVGLWAHLMIREYLARMYGRKYTNDVPRSIRG